MKRVVAAVMALVSLSASAESIKSFLDKAESANIDRQISIEQRNKAAADYRAAWTGLFPSLTVSGAWTHNQFEAGVDLPKKDENGNTVIENGKPVTVRAVIIPSDQFDAIFRFDLPLIDTGRWFRAMAAGTAEESAALRELVMRDLVRRQIVGAYYGYSAALAVRESAKKSANVALEQLKLMEVRANVGTVTELDLLRAKAEAARTRQVVADTENLVATTRRTLRTLSGLEPPEVLPMDADDLTPAAALEELEGRVGELPAVKAAEKDAQAAGKFSAAAKLALVPIVSAQFTERLTNATGFAGQAASYTAGVNLAWRLDVPTFMNMSSQASAESVANLATERARLVARDQVNSDWQRLQSALIKVDAAKAQVEAARRATQVARDRYAAGAATQVDVIQAERDVFGAEVAQIQARTELASARLSLRISAALPLE